jgi:signal transduction histidine kinase
MLGYKNDTVSLATYHPDSGIVGKLFIATGRDNTGNGSWIPTMSIVGVDDFDADGRDEAIFVVFTERDIGPRITCCVELETLTLEWSLNTAGGIRGGTELIRAETEAGPRLIFVTGNPGHGRSDENYRDSWGYLSAVSTDGELLFNYVIKLGAVTATVLQSQCPGVFYMIHEIMPTPQETVARMAGEDRLDELRSEGSFLSKVDKHGQIIRTTELPCSGYGNFWLQPYGPEEEIALYVTLSDRRVLVLDTALTELAVSDTVRMAGHMMGMSFDGHENAQVFSDGIYTSDLTKLLSFPRGIGDFIPFTHDSLGSVVSLGLGGSGYLWVGRVEKKPWIDLVSVFYLNNQNYVLAIVSCLIGGLLVTNFYRRRNKQNYTLIAKQKEELTNAHQDLREAQARLVAQEKYRQARDIAGGVSHEIRNALFPAQAALNRLRKSIQGDASAEAADKIERAVKRGIEITKLITRFTRLGSDFVPRPTNIAAVVKTVVGDNEARIDGQQVRVQITGGDQITVMSEDNLLYVLLNNLILNSLDALENRPNPNINVVWAEHSDHTEIVVEDNGVGIDEMSQSRIFDAFYSSKPQTGTGIGMTMVRRVVDLCGGEIDVHSVPEEGTSIQVSFGSADTPG